MTRGTGIERGGPLVAGHAPMFARRSMAMCAVGDTLVLFGGVGAAGTESILDVANDCWLFDTRRLAWRAVLPHDPWPSPRRCVGVAPEGTGMLMWGGSGITQGDGPPRYTFLNDSWHFDVDTLAWVPRRASDDHLVAPIEHQAAPYPSPRYTPVLVRVGHRYFLFGGYTEDRLGKRKLNDAWVGDGHRWEPVPACGVAGFDEQATWPGPRYGCMAAAQDDAVFVFGGFSDEGDHNDLWQFSMAERRWMLLMPDSGRDDAPPARYCAALAYDHRRLFLFGGRSRRYPKHGFNDLWVFDLERRQWVCAHGSRVPHRYDEWAAFPGYHAKAAAAVVAGEWYLWGGEGLSGHVSDFWRFSFDTSQWQLLQAARPDDPSLW